MSSATPTVQLEDERVRVTRWDFEPGDSTGPHTHELPYVVVPVVDGTTEITVDDGSVSRSDLRSGVSYARAAGARHEVVNVGTGHLAFVEVELKAASA